MGEIDAVVLVVLMVVIDAVVVAKHYLLRPQYLLCIGSASCRRSHIRRIRVVCIVSIVVSVCVVYRTIVWRQNQA